MSAYPHSVKAVCNLFVAVQQIPFGGNQLGLIKGPLIRGNRCKCILVFRTLHIMSGVDKQVVI